jgi:hypothetical protein
MAGLCSSRRSIRPSLGRAAIQVAFTIFVLVETWLIPFEGYLIDRFGPRPTGVVRAAMHGQGHGGDLGAVHERADGSDRQLDRCIRGGPLNILAALLASFALRPLRVRYLRAAQALPGS